MGDIKHARLFGYFKTDSIGQFEFETIKPKGYPKSNLPAHIHAWMREGNTPLTGVGEFQFDDDPRLTREMKIRSEQDGNIISKNSGTEKEPIYFYKITAK